MLDKWLTNCIFKVEFHFNSLFSVSGCTINPDYKGSTFMDSLDHLYLLFPPVHPTFIFVYQQGTVSQIRLGGSQGYSSKQTWMKFRLILTGMLELQFSNGSSWLKEEHRRLMTQEPQKKISIRGEPVIEDCPQGIILCLSYTLYYLFGMWLAKQKTNSSNCSAFFHWHNITDVKWGGFKCCLCWLVGVLTQNFFFNEVCYYSW